IDPTLMNQKAAGMASAAELQKQLWSESAEKRRELLMPFFWKQLAAAGMVLGNVSRGSSVQVTNRYRVSYPGYSEILTGRAQDELVRGNDKIQNPAPTVLEFLADRLKLLRHDVALFASWDVFPYIGESQRGKIFINGGYMPADDSPRMRDLSALQFRVRTPWDSVRHDYITLEMAVDYIKRRNPKVTYIALGETDDWAHDRRYDRTLTAIQDFDGALKQIWELLSNSSFYRGRTLLVVTSDHGRGSTREDWHSHGEKIAGADQIWIALLGPGVPAVGEVSNAQPVFQRDIAPTILDLMGVDSRQYQGAAGKTIALHSLRSR
ncbi:MAG TPA: sulfatase-like hydrolase/transferase, partial [Bryobacteraceae bacterium]|nr:sulfatase-like hydrolase/transferase [Bryobacteraceae bacterium]